MKRLLLFICLVVLVGCPQPPKPPPPPKPQPPPVPVAPVDPAPITDGNVTVAYENGLRIIVKRNSDAELVSMQLYIKGGASLRTEANAGLEQLALDVATQGGTTRLDKQAFGERLNELGSSLGASSLHSFSIIGAKSLTREFEATFELLADAFLIPALLLGEVELLRERQLAGIKGRGVAPDGQLDLAVVDAVYAGHPYGNLSSGTVTSVEAFAPGQVGDHLAALRQTSRLELVVVGNVDPDVVRALVKARFGTLPRGDYQPKAIAKPVFEQAHVEVIEAKLPTNYIEASFIGPGWHDEDFAAGIVAMRILGNRVWEEVRTKRNLSYAPKAGFAWRGEVTRGFLYVTAVDPDTTMKVMLDEVRSLQTTPVGPIELAGAKAVFLTTHLMGNQTADGESSWLAACDIVGGDWKLSTQLPARIEAVTAEQMMAFANKHIHWLQTVVIGDPTKVDTALFESL